MTNFRVTKSTVDYEQHKKDIYNKIASINPKAAKKYIDFYSSRYDDKDRSFIDWNLGLKLLYDYNQVMKKNSMTWYAIVGLGGTGKTTIARNIAYFLDPKFNDKLLSTKLLDIVKMFDNHLEEEGRAFVLDEPDLSVSPTSKEGLVTKDVFGKARQQKAFLLFCATDLTDIPNFIYKKLNRLIFCPQQGKGLYFRDNPNVTKPLYFLGNLKTDYMRKLGYASFKKYTRFGLKFNSSGATPLDKDNNKYLVNKKDDYRNSLKRAQEILKNNASKLEKTKDTRLDYINNMTKEGFTQTQIAKLLGCSRKTVYNILEKGGNATP